MIRVLSDDQVAQIHAASLTLLERVGMIFEDEQAVCLLVSNGAKATGYRVRLPSKMVEESLSLCPKQFTLLARNPANDVKLGQGGVYFTNGYGATFVKDLETDIIRPATLEDVRQAILLADALESVHYCLLPAIPQDMPSGLGELAGAALLLAITDKHVAPSLSTVDQYPELIRMAYLVSDRSCPIISLGCTISSPLRMSSDSIARLRLSVQHGIPFRLVSAPIAGITGPATLAGTLVLQNAEILGAITLAQLLSPGSPVIYGTFAAAGDMSSGKIAMGGPELALLNAASAQLCRYYGVPLAYGTGGTCDSH